MHKALMNYHFHPKLH